MVVTPAAPDLQQLYQSRLRPRLEALEADRLKLRFAIIASALMVGLPAVGFCQSNVVGLVLPEAQRSWVAPVSFVLIFVGVIVAARSYAVPGITAYLTYRARFKRDVVAEMFSAVCPGATYAPDRYITEAVFDATGLFATRGSFRGDDLVRGRIGETPFEASELQRQYTEGSGKNSTTCVTFHGLFLHLDFNKIIRGRTIVQPTGTERSRQGPRGDLTRVVLEDPEFDRQFEVYSTNPVEARYILTPVLMERVVDIQRKTGKPIFLGFGSSSACVAVHYGGALFEPSIAQTTSFAALAEMADHFRLAGLVVQELDLNTRIWTKDVDPSLLAAPPAVSPFEAVAGGELNESSLFASALKMAGKMYEDVNRGAPPEPPERTRARLEPDAEGLSVRFGLPWWFAPCLVFSSFAALVALAALAAVLNPDLIRPALAAFVPPESVDLVAGARTGAIVTLIGALIVGALPASAALSYVRRVHIGRDEILVTRGLHLRPRRYPRTNETRILQLDNLVFLGRANEFKLVNMSLSPTLRTPLEARWIAWQMRVALDETAGRLTRP